MAAVREGEGKEVCGEGVGGGTSRAGGVGDEKVGERRERVWRAAQQMVEMEGRRMWGRR